MYNKKVLSKAVSNLDSAKAPAKKRDKIYTNKESLSPFISMEGYKQGPPPAGTNYRILGDTLYNPTPYPIEAVSDNGIRKKLKPYDTENTYFPGATHVDEYEDYYDDELTDDEIEELRRGGYVVEELPKAQTGQQIYTYAPRPEAKYKKDDKGNWLINLPSTNGQFVPINDPSGKRAGELNEKATLDPSQFRRQYDALTDVKPQVIENTAIPNAPKADNTLIDRAVQQKQAERAIVGEKIRANPLLTEDQKLEIITNPQKLDENVHLAYEKGPDEVKAYTPDKPQGFWDKAGDIAANPMTSLGFLMRGEAIPDYMQRDMDRGTFGYYANGELHTERNPLDFAVADMTGLSMVNDARSVYGGLNEGDYTQAGLGLLSFIPGFGEARKVANASGVLSDYKNIEQLRLALRNKDFKQANQIFPDIFPTQEIFDQTKNQANQLLKKYGPEFKQKFGAGSNEEILLYGAHDDLGKLNTEQTFLAEDPFAQSVGLNKDLTPQEKFLGDAYQLEFSGHFNKKPQGNPKFAEYLSEQFEPVITKNQVNRPVQVSRVSNFDRPVKTIRPGTTEPQMVHYNDLMEGDVIYPEHNWSTTSNVEGDVWGSNTSQTARINLPEGQSTFRPNMYKGSQYANEEELVLPSRLGYRVSGINPTGYGQDSPRFVLDVANPYKKGGEKKYSRSLSAKNRLFIENKLTKKQKSKKNKIFDPKSKYFQPGGIVVEGYNEDSPWLGEKYQDLGATLTKGNFNLSAGNYFPLSVKEPTGIFNPYLSVGYDLNKNRNLAFEVTPGYAGFTFTKSFQDGGTQCDDEGRCYETDQAQELLDKTHQTVTNALKIDRNVLDAVRQGYPANEVWQEYGVKTADQLTGDPYAYACANSATRGYAICDPNVKDTATLSNDRMKNAVAQGTTPFRKVGTYTGNKYKDVVKPGNLISFMDGPFKHMVKNVGPNRYAQSTGSVEDWNEHLGVHWVPGTIPATVYEYAPYYDQIQALEEQARINPTYVPGTSSVGTLPIRPAEAIALQESERVLPVVTQDLGMRQFGGIPTLPLNKNRQVLRDWLYGQSIGMLQEADGGYMDLDLSDEEIQRMKDLGYYVEEY